MILKTNVDIVDLQTFKTNNNVRPHIDMGEIDGKTLGELFELKRLDFQKVGVVLGTNAEIQTLQKLYKMYTEQTELRNIVDGITLQ
jgi:hypothetical protein